MRIIITGKKVSYCTVEKTLWINRSCSAICKQACMTLAQSRFSASGIFKKRYRLFNRTKRFLSCYEIEHPMAKDRKECQNLSTQNLFTISRQSSAKNACLGALFNPRLMGNRGGKAKFLHIHHGFVHVFSPYLMPFCGFVSTPKNKKSTPNFFSALTF
jgi:hypothetical protein